MTTSPSVRVTVITPCFNAVKFIEQCVRSVAEQQPHVERHIVMDGGSTDGTVKVLEECASRFPHLYFRSEPDGGQSDALRKALELVETEYFGWLNADDFYLPQAIEHLVSQVDEAAPPSIVYGDYIRVDEHGVPIHRRRQPSFSYWDCLHFYMTIQNSAAIFRTETAARCGGFDARLQFAMDYDFVLRMARHGRVVHTPGFLAAFRIHGDSKTTTMDDVNRSEVRSIRSRYSPLPSFMLPMASLVGKGRVFMRMLTEGCLATRLESRAAAIRAFNDQLTESTYR